MITANVIATQMLICGKGEGRELDSKDIPIMQKTVFTHTETGTALPVRSACVPGFPGLPKYRR